MERKIFTELNDEDPNGLHESLVKIGFRRSQDIAYRPSCDFCTECKSVRIPVASFVPNRTYRRLINLNSDLVVTQKQNTVTQEQYNLLSTYLKTRHPDGGMTEMNFDDYKSMVECSPINTCLFEYRLPDEKVSGSIHPGKLIAITLTDIMNDGLSMVYSFYDVNEKYNKRSLGTYVILDHIARSLLMKRDYVYLGYWVKNSPKMAYKTNFRPLEVLDGDGWSLMKR